ncbi:(Fe-S)-binding protein [bacterium]|nr:MAG: (Fe-S)-binding protein [bacterium]
MRKVPPQSSIGSGVIPLQFNVHDLGELTTHCIRCGFCLEACPTFTETGSELESPRGRIYLVRSALDGKLDWQDDVRPHLDRCLGCRACETACPSGVKYGAILEMARDRLENERRNISKQALLASTAKPGLLRTQLALSRLLPGRRVPGFVSQLVSGTSPEADLPNPQPLPNYPPLDESTLPPVRGEVYLLEGCAMRVLYPGVHLALRRLLRRVGFVVREAPTQGCCGSIYAHNGDLDEANRLATKLAAALPGDLPVIVDSAGCGSWMKESIFADRAFDASEFLLAEGLANVLNTARFEKTLTYHDACHLAHGQGIRSAPRELLSAIPALKMVELPEADTCCGSAGIYNITQPKMARSLLERKFANIESTDAEIVALGNPGCHAWIAQAAREHGGQVRVMHTLEVLEQALNPA